MRASPLFSSPSTPSRRGFAFEVLLRSSGKGPGTTFALVLFAATVAAIAMWVDAVGRFSRHAFVVGMALTVALALVVGGALQRLRGSSWMLAASMVLPTIAGAVIGMVVQAFVLQEVSGRWGTDVRDLGGLVDTRSPVAWVASGIVIGGFPALFVSVFLLLAARAMRRMAGHDAHESFGVAFVGGAGVLASGALPVVDALARLPLLVVTSVAAFTLLAIIVVDGSRVRFLRDVYAGAVAGFDIVPASHLSNDPSLAPLVAGAGSQGAVLVRRAAQGSSYRVAAVEPVALVAPTEAATLRPLLRRRVVAAAMFLVMAALAGFASVAQVA